MPALNVASMDYSLLAGAESLPEQSTVDSSTSEDESSSGSSIQMSTGLSLSGSSSDEDEPAGTGAITALRRSFEAKQPAKVQEWTHRMPKKVTQVCMRTVCGLFSQARAS